MKAPLFIFAAGCTVIFATSRLRAEQLPRYKFTPGQELVYEGTSVFKYEGGSNRTTDNWKFWVTKHNADGSFHMVGQNESHFAYGSADDKSPLSSGTKRGAFGSFDIFPDGMVTNAPEDVDASVLTTIFLKLPADMASARAGWITPEQDSGKFLNLLDPESKGDSGKWIFPSTHKGIFDDIYLSSQKSRIYFDGDRGLVTKVEFQSSQGYGFNGKGTGSIELKSDKNLGTADAAQLSQETEAFARAKAALRTMYADVRKGTNCSEALMAARKTLREGRQNATLPLIKAQYDEQLKKLDESGQYLADDSKKADLVLNKPAATWSVTDLSGKKHDLADYRGKVVVLDFWYRGCGWCIRAMPQIKELANQFHDKPVAVLGMNTDKQEKDAQFVSDKLSLNYPTLKAEGIPEKYSVQGFPTLIIIDQKGVVRARHVGYSPTLREEVAKTIADLLARGN